MVPPSSMRLPGKRFATFLGAWRWSDELPSNAWPGLRSWGRRCYHYLGCLPPRYVVVRRKYGFRLCRWFAGTVPQGTLHHS